MRRGYGKAADWWGVGVLMYETIFKVTPFYNYEKRQIYANII